MTVTVLPAPSNEAVTPGGTPSTLSCTVGFWLFNDWMEILVVPVPPCTTGPMKGGDAVRVNANARPDVPASMRLPGMTLNGLVSCRPCVSATVSGWKPKGMSDGMLMTAVKAPLVTSTGVVKVMVLGPS